jgi:cell division protein FtsQ
MNEYRGHRATVRHRPAQKGRKKASPARRAPAPKGAPAEGRRRWALPAAAGLAVFLAAAAALAGASSWFARSPLFSLREIEMEPCAHVTKEDVRSAVGGAGDRNLFSLSPAAAGKRLQQHPWVRSVWLRKAYPDTLVVRVEERVPLAMVNFDALYYVDGEGKVFKRVAPCDSKSYPILTGFSRAELAGGDPVAAENLGRTLSFLRRLEEGSLRRNISELHFEPQEGYTVVTRDSGLQLKVGLVEPVEASRRIELAMRKIPGGTGAAVADLTSSGKIFLRSGE